MRGVNHQELQLVNTSAGVRRKFPPKLVLHVMLSKSESDPNQRFFFSLYSIRDKKQNSWWEQNGYSKGKSTTKLVHLYFLLFQLCI